MYVQPYEAQQSSFASPSLGHRSVADPSYASDTSTPDTESTGDGISQSSSWSQMLSDVGDSAGALEDGPLTFGLGGMLTSLTSMMQQLAQMIQSLVERANGGGDDQGAQQQNPVQAPGHRRAHGMTADGMMGPGCGCGCTQQAQGPEGQNGG